MNLRKKDPILAEFERSLGRMLTNWSRRDEPPRDARVQLMAAAQQIQQERGNALLRFLESKPNHGAKSEDVAMLAYMPQMSFMSALIHY